MNILLVNYIHRDTKNGDLSIGGVEYHRMYKPHLVMKSMFEDVDYMMAPGVGEEINDILVQTNLVIFCRMIPEESIEYLNKMGIPFGLDLDDYWHLPKHHILYDDYTEHDKPSQIIKSIKNAHFVTCTTPILAEKIKEYNENVYVCPNGIDHDDPIWQPNKSESKRIRFGFTGGNTHLFDVNRIAHSVRKAYSDIKFFNKAQIVLTGYRHSEGKQLGIERIYENILTDNRALLKYYPQYNHDLEMGREGTEKNAPYRRIMLKDVMHFGEVYNDIDICVAPLEDNEFNNCKSELKMLEAAFKDCAIMCHHVKPYTLLATDENSFDLGKKTFYEWSRIILNNPNLVADKKAQLIEDVKPYSLSRLSKNRYNIYKKHANK